MITLYNLENSRSQRVAWLLEELGIPYEVQEFKRDPVTKLAPQALRDIHPLGKSPLISDDGVVVAESGAIVEYILARYGNGRLQPEISSSDYASYLQWLHYAEGSAMGAFVLKYFAEGKAEVFCQTQFDLHINYIENSLNGKTWFLGDTFTAADIMMSFALQFALLFVEKDRFPNIRRFVSQVESHPSYRKACERVGEVHLG
ncbi:glutathione S-transferase [Actinobacillus succinogenes]|uniref:glutathione transferase n=1 Tax=Actinobacillus succinogenes (strain ATCC 55618 / DSM 22257 / CCUG 43843 / 130Z) TaxID=339671 RepID=A6VPV0_ACTSZ|nr:glutathione S-transferase family protein [Actinobacillus succinogenes]ABR74997.1 Glutathione S-transferase domain [Actinobacillus succinogenes 130Z]PHI40594.1 glutathione S-transferase [Actinobacillus succinogenes]